jgi:hypothetical protein
LENATEDGLFIDRCIERGLLNHQSNSYDDWRNVGFAIKSSLKGEDGFKLFDKFSRLNIEKYDEEYTKNFWTTIKDTNKKPITIGSLKKWAKNADSEKYKEINNTLNPKLSKKDLRLLKKNTQSEAERERNELLEKDKFQYKLPSGETVDFKAWFMDGVLTDLDATEKIFKLYPHWVFCLEELYVFDNLTGMWSNSKTSYLNVIKQHAEFIHIMILDDDTGNWEKHEFRSYGNCLSSMEKIIPLMKTMNMNNNWIKENQSSSLGKILFQNGYYDFHQQKFYNKNEVCFNPKIVFFGRIHHDFEAFSEDDMIYMDNIRERLFYLTLGKEVGDYFITNLARGLSGEMMKRILFGLGDTNCGKGVLTIAMMNSCGDYVGSFNAENLAYKETSQDEAQIMRWCLLLRYKRIIFSNEMKSNIELNGNFIKKISSGGDPLIGRTHCKEETEFNTHFLPVCLANDMNKIKPYDDAVHGRVKCINYKKQFVLEPSNEFELQMDLNLKDELKTLRFQRVFVGLLIRSHADFVDNNRVEIEPAEVANAKAEWIEQDKSPITTFLKDYDITNNAEDFIKSKDIQEWIEAKSLGISITKFGMEMKKYAAINKLNNVETKKKKINGKTENCWFGISYNNDEDDDA